jgi:hypothetical protein
MKHLILFFMLWTVFLIVGSTVNAAELPGYSGMVQISKNTFLTVNDRKKKKDPCSRLGVLTVTQNDGILFYPLNVDNWHGKSPNDLEACCSIPGRPNEYLLAESGYHKGNYGRIFHIRIIKSDDRIWKVEVIKPFRIYHRELDDERTTYKGDQVEGIACFHAFGKTILVYGERGGKTETAHKLARIIWGELNLDDYSFNMSGDEALVTKSLLGDRDCSELFLKVDNGKIIVRSVATIDIGDTGPFKSVIYDAGIFILNTEEEKIEFMRNSNPVVLWQLDGLKVEALAAPPSFVPQSGISIGTDDEDYGGLWRPLFKNKKSF